MGSQSTSASNDFDAAWVATTQDALQVLARKWTAAILGQLRGGPQRAFELKARLPRVHTKVLRETLRSLEDDGMVERCLSHDPVGNVGVAYQLTADGCAALDVLHVVFEWRSGTVSGPAA